MDFVPKWVPGLDTSHGLGAFVMELAARAADLIAADGLGAAVTMLTGEGTGMIPRIMALRVATGLSLKDAMEFLGVYTERLDHITSAHVALLAEYPSLPGEKGLWIRSLFVSALVRGEPGLTLHADGGEILFFADRAKAGHTTGDLAALREEVAAVADHPLGRRITLTPTGLAFDLTT